MNYIKIFFRFIKMRKNLVKSKDEIKSIQEKALKKIIKYAYDNSEYYNTLYKAAGIKRDDLDNIDISKLPSVKKSEFLKKFDRVITDKDVTQEELRVFDAEIPLDEKLFKNKYHVVHSSGTTGKPGYFVYDKYAWEYMLSSMLRAALWGMSFKNILKMLISKPKVMYIAATDGRYGGAMAVSDGIKGIGGGELFLDINVPLVEWKNKVNSFNPDIIIGYPSAVKILCKIIEAGEITLHIKRFVSCGEPLNSGMRRYFEGLFKAPVINYYGASENLVLGVEAGNGLVLFDDINYYEIVNDKMYVTCLYNFKQPLIRYEISDRLKLRETKHGFTTADNVLGRDEDIIWLTNKYGEREFIHPLAVEGYSEEGMLDYQFEVEEDNSFKLIIEADEKCKASIKCKMEENIKELLMEKNLDNIEFTIGFADRIISDKNSGKKQLVINKNL